MSEAPEPGILTCGCLWDGEMLDMAGDCVIDDHGIKAPYIKRRLSINGVPMDTPAWPLDWPNPKGKWRHPPHDT